MVARDTAPTPPTNVLHNRGYDEAEGNDAPTDVDRTYSVSRDLAAVANMMATTLFFVLFVFPILFHITEIHLFSRTSQQPSSMQDHDEFDDANGTISALISMVHAVEVAQNATIDVIPGCDPDGGPINITQWRTDEDAYRMCGFPPHMREWKDLGPGRVGCGWDDDDPVSDITRYPSVEYAYLTCGFPKHMKIARFGMYPGCLESGEGPKDIHLWPSDKEAYEACGFPRHMKVRRTPVGHQKCRTIPYATNEYGFLRFDVPDGPEDLQAWPTDAWAYVACGFPPHMRQQRDVPRRLFCESC